MEIHPGVPNVYYEQGVVKGEDTKPLIAKAEGDGRHRPPIAAASRICIWSPTAASPTSTTTAC